MPANSATMRMQSAGSSGSGARGRDLHGPHPLPPKLDLARCKWGGGYVDAVVAAEEEVEEEEDAAAAAEDNDDSDDDSDDDDDDDDKEEDEEEEAHKRGAYEDGAFVDRRRRDLVSFCAMAITVSCDMRDRIRPLWCCCCCRAGAL